QRGRVLGIKPQVRHRDAPVRGDVAGASLLQPRNVPIVEARKRGLSSAEFCIHWPLGSSPTMSMVACGSALLMAIVDDNRSFLAMSWMSSSRPVRNSHPGPTPNLSAYSFNTS